MTDIDFEELDRAVQSAIDDFSGEDEQLDHSVQTPQQNQQTPHSNEPRQAVASQSISLPTKTRAQRSLDSFSSPKADIKLTPTVKPEIVQPEQKGRMIDVVNPIQRKPVHEVKREVVQEEIIHEPLPQEILDPEDLPEVKESPFIENLQVQKRPLGGFSKELGASPKEKPVETLVEEKVEAKAVEAPTYIGGVDEAEELPPELHQDVLDVEATGMLYPQEPLSDENVGLAEAQQLQSPAVSSKTKATQTSKTTEAPAETNIFASEAYSKPLEHPKKKKSGWFKVFLIVLLFILGIAGGAAVYYFMI